MLLLLKACLVVSLDTQNVTHLETSHNESLSDFPFVSLRYLLAMGASTEVENENGEKPADLIDPDCKELAKLFETGCV